MIAAILAVAGSAGAAPAPRAAPGARTPSVGAATSAKPGATRKNRPTASARALAVRILVPGANGATTPVAAAADSATESADRPSFSYPKDGSVIITGPTRATATARTAQAARAGSSASVKDVTIFDGEITADAVKAEAAAATGKHSATGSVGGTGVANLQALGVKRVSGQVQLGNWGRLTIARTSIDRRAPHGTKGYDGSVTALDIRLIAPHGGLPAGSEIEVGSRGRCGDRAANLRTRRIDARGGPRRPPAASPAHDRPARSASRRSCTPALTAGPYVFPVFGRADLHAELRHARSGRRPTSTATTSSASSGSRSSPSPTERSSRSAGTARPATGSGSATGQGNEFYYAHLSAFSTLAANGAHVQAGQVIGFMGNTGQHRQGADAPPFRGAPGLAALPRLRRRRRPDPYLASWHRLASLAFPVATGWAPNVPGTIKAPEPGAVLLGSTDISSADGLDPASLRRRRCAPGLAVASARGRSTRSTACSPLVAPPVTMSLMNRRVSAP